MKGSAATPLQVKKSRFPLLIRRFIDVWNSMYTEVGLEPVNLGTLAQRRTPFILCETLSTFVPCTPVMCFEDYSPQTCLCRFPPQYFPASSSCGSHRDYSSAARSAAIFNAGPPQSDNNRVIQLARALRPVHGRTQKVEYVYAY